MCPSVCVYRIKAASTDRAALKVCVSAIGEKYHDGASCERMHGLNLRVRLHLYLDNLSEWRGVGTTCLPDCGSVVPGVSGQTRLQAVA